MKTFIHLNVQECRVIYPEVAANAQTLYNSAKILAEHENYGNAVGLLILGSEEYIKCCILFLESYGFNLLKIKEIQGIFSKHRSRHFIVRDFYALWKVINYVFNTCTDTTGKDLAFPVLQSAIQLLAAQNNYHWWEKADFLKQKGLYVDYVNRLICSSNLTRQDYEITLAKTKHFPVEMENLMNQLKAMDPQVLDCLRKRLEDAKLPALIAEASIRKVPKDLLF